MAPCINFVTGNSNKLREVKAILEPGIEVRSNPIDVEEVQGSIEEVTESKCRRAAELVNGPVLVEDTALCFNALAGLPGPYITEPANSSYGYLLLLTTPCWFEYSKWFLAGIGHEGLNNLLAAYADKSAEAVCTFGYSEGPGHKPIIFQGRCPVSCLICAFDWCTVCTSNQPASQLILSWAEGKYCPCKGADSFW
ncbi:Inosine triphosphate pyrophosphatase [Metarhizium anisopliae]|nr:Inosine triphosphate pyrophosphatase [Metarhizium anisopliae]